VTIDGPLIPNLIDELPVLAVAAAYAEGRTVFRDAAELRVKETDRIAATAEFLRAMGAEIEELEDGLIIHGGKPLRGAEVDSHGDHRIAMAAAVAALGADGETTIRGADAVGVSYPGFWSELAKLAGEA
jgi:3-phosphoshikimate 1-carboxyvinyltransferase